MKKKPVYFKVVEVKRGNKGERILQSAFSNSIELEYKVRRKIVPRIQKSKLFVFDNLENALEFAHPVMHEIYTCLVENPKPAPRFVPCDVRVGILKRFNEFWQTLTLTNADGLLTPKGTYLVDSVTLKKRIVKLGGKLCR